MGSSGYSIWTHKNRYVMVEVRNDENEDNLVEVIEYIELLEKENKKLQAEIAELRKADEVKRASGNHNAAHGKKSFNLAPKSKKLCKSKKQAIKNVVLKHLAGGKKSWAEMKKIYIRFKYE